MPATLPTKPGASTAQEVVGRVSVYLDRLFTGAGRMTGHMKDRVAERIANRLADALTRHSSAVVLTEQEYREYIETVDVLEDADAMAQLASADREPDADARDYDEIRRELGLA